MYAIRSYYAPLFTDARRDELNMIFHFDLVRLDRDGWRKLDWTLPQVKAVYGRIDSYNFV